MLHRMDDGVDASRRCRVTRDRDVRTTNKLRMTNKLKHRTFRQLKLKKMKKLSKQFAFQPKRGNSYIMLCKLCLPRQTELSAYKNESSNLRKHVLVSTVFVPFH